jgi:hypothetical protein
VVVAGAVGEEEHVDDDFVHGAVVLVEGADETDVGGFDVEVAGVRHAEVQFAEPEEHVVHAVVALLVGYAGEAGDGGGEGHRLVLDDGQLVVFVDVGVVDDGGYADLTEDVVVLYGYVVENASGVYDSVNLYVIVDPHIILELHASYHRVVNDGFYALGMYIGTQLPSDRLRNIARSCQQGGRQITCIEPYLHP